MDEQTYNLIQQAIPYAAGAIAFVGGLASLCKWRAKVRIAEIEENNYAARAKSDSQGYLGVVRMRVEAAGKLLDENTYENDSDTLKSDIDAIVGELPTLDE